MHAHTSLDAQPSPLPPPPPFLCTLYPTAQLRRLVLEMRRGARFVTYQDLARFWPAEPYPFQQLRCNLDEQVRVLDL